VEPDINSVEVHPQLSHNGHPVDGWCAGGCWFTVANKFEPPFLYTYYLRLLIIIIIIIRNLNILTQKDKIHCRTT
jgi:hypothetical protein